MNRYLFTLVALVAVFLGSWGTTQAVSVFITGQGGTGTSSPSGILYGDNGGTTHLNTVTIGTNLTFSGGVLNATGGGSTFPFTPNAWGNSTSTVIGFTQGIITNASTTFAQLSTGAVYDQNGLILAHATTSSVTNFQDVWRDGNGNVFANNFVPNLTSTVSGGGTVVLTPASSRYQLLTGSASHTYQMPNGNASGMNTGATWDFNNNSTGVLHVQTHGGAFIADVPAGGFDRVYLTDNSTSEGSWETHAYLGHSNLSGAGTLGLGTTTTPWADLSVTAGFDYLSHATTTVFLVASSSAGNATSTLFSIDSTGLIKTFLGAGAVSSDANGILRAGTLSIANGGTGSASLTGDNYLYTNHAGTAVLTAASSSETCSSPLSCTSFDVLKNGGAISLGTVGEANGGTGTTTGSPGWLAYYGGSGVYQGVATSTLSASSPLTGSFTQVGTGGSLGCQTASGAQAGCLSSSDWTTFNNKLGTYDAWTHNAGVFFSSATTTNFIGFGTTTPFAQLQVASSSASAANYTTLVLTDTNAGANLKHWFIDSEGGAFFIGTTTDKYATSSANALSIDKNAAVTIPNTLTVGSLTNGNCVQAGAGGLLTTVGSACGSGGGGTDPFTHNSGKLFSSGTTTDFFGFGTTSPFTNLQTASSSASASNFGQFSITDTNAGTDKKHWLFSSILGDLYIGTTTDKYATTSTPLLTFRGATGRLGIGTTTPLGTFTIFTGGSTDTANAFTINNHIGSTTLEADTIDTNANIFSVSTSSGLTYLTVTSGGLAFAAASQPATSTAIQIDWVNTPNQVEIQLGGSATSISFTSGTTSTYWGSTKRVWVCNPNQTAGALTWKGVEWIGSTPTQTTTSNQCDIYSFDVTRATSTSAYKIAGTAGTGFQ